MKANLTARMKGEDKISIELSFSGHGWDVREVVEAEAKKYSDAIKIGMALDRGRYISEISATEEACKPFVAFAEKHGLEIVQL